MTLKIASTTKYVFQRQLKDRNNLLVKTEIFYLPVIWIYLNTVPFYAKIRHNFFIQLYMTLNFTFTFWRRFVICFYFKTFWPHYKLYLRSYGQLLFNLGLYLQTLDLTTTKVLLNQPSRIYNVLWFSLKCSVYSFLSVNYCVCEYYTVKTSLV